MTEHAWEQFIDGWKRDDGVKVKRYLRSGLYVIYRADGSLLKTHSRRPRIERPRQWQSDEAAMRVADRELP